MFVNGPELPADHPWRRQETQDCAFNYPPHWLSPGAQVIWDQYSNTVEHRTYFKLQHIRLLADLCELEAWLENNHIRAEVAVVYNRLGDAKMNPALQAWMYIFKHVQVLRKELAIHPRFDETLVGWQNGSIQCHIPGDSNLELPTRVQFYLPDNGRHYDRDEE